MGFLGVEFNVVNFVGLPISVGLGAVYGVHAMHRMRELGDETVLTTSTGPALLLSGVTDIVGFASLMIAAGFLYGAGGDGPWSKAFLHGIAAGAVGLIVVVLVQLGAKTLKTFADYVFVAATAAAVAFFKVPVPYALIVAGIVAIWWHRPRDKDIP